MMCWFLEMCFAIMRARDLLIWYSRIGLHFNTSAPSAWFNGRRPSGTKTGYLNYTYQTNALFNTFSLMAAVLLTLFPNAFTWIKKSEFRFQFSDAHICHSAPVGWQQTFNTHHILNGVQYWFIVAYIMTCKFSLNIVLDCNNSLNCQIYAQILRQQC